MSDVYARDRQTIEEAQQALAPLPGQVGALIYISGRWVGLDVLAGPGLFARACTMSPSRSVDWGGKEGARSRQRA